MTIKEYIKGQLGRFNVNVSDAQMIDFLIKYGISFDVDYLKENMNIVGFAIIDIVEELCFLPKVKSVNESGFSITFDYSEISKYYLWLCRKYGRKPDCEILSMVGMSTITDKSDIW